MPVLQKENRTRKDSFSISEVLAEISGPELIWPGTGSMPLLLNPLSQKCCKALLVLVGNGLLLILDQDPKQSWPVVSLTAVVNVFFWGGAQRAELDGGGVEGAHAGGTRSSLHHES